jgi:hypothetical protein
MIPRDLGAYEEVQDCELEKPGTGIAFVVPVERVVGVSHFIDKNRESQSLGYRVITQPTDIVFTASNRQFSQLQTTEDRMAEQAH